jgi:predicted N-formylglutamate amidohydrolase
VIDLNRPLASPESIPEQSAGVPVFGNCGLTPQARAARVAALFAPYHQAITELLEGRVGRPSLLISIHSFTPVLGDERRPWPISVAYGRDPRLADLLRPALKRRGDLLVGNNQPYGVDDEHDYTLPTHGEGRGIPNAMIEIRQDGLSTPADIAGWVGRLADAYEHLRGTAATLFTSRCH